MKERQSSVLIVAAAPEDRAALHDALSRDPAARYVITEAESVRRALEVCRAWKPDCLILDYDLPDLSGLDALKKPTAEEGESTCAMVALVGAGDAQLAVEAMKSGALECLEKGRAGGTELRRAVSQAIEKAEQRRQASAREHELIEKNLALEADLADLRREAAVRGQEEEARQVARAGAGSSRAVVSRPERAFYNQTDELRNSEAQLRAILDHSSASIFVKDLEGRFLRVNRMYEALHGMTEAEVLGKTDHDIHAKEIADVFVANDREVIAANRPLQFEEQVDTVDGRRQYIAVKFPLYDDSGRLYGVCGIATDITERKRAEVALRESSEERLNIAMRAGGIGMVAWDIRADSIVWSEKFLDIYGLPHGRTSARYEDWRERVYTEDLPAVEALIRETFEKKLPDWRFEYRIVRADNGDVRWIESSHHVFYDAQGAPLRTVGAVRDITERKRSEEALKLGEERLSLALKAAAIGTFDLDIPSGKHFLTEIGCAIFGLPLSMSTSAYEDWRKYVHPDDILDCEAKLQDAVQHRLEELSAQYRILRADTGELRWVESRCRIFYNAQGAPLRLIGTILDITDRIAAEEAIRESEERFRQIADAMPQIVYTSGPDGLIDYTNQQWFEYVGVPVEQSTGRNWIAAIHPDDVESVGQWERKSVETGQPFDTEFRLRGKDGQYRWFMSRAIPIRNAQGRIIKWIGTSTDIHDRKQAEAEREESLAREQAARAEAEHAEESIRRLQAVTDSALRSLEFDDLLREMLDRVRELLGADSAAIYLLAEDGGPLVMSAAIGMEEEALGLRMPVGSGVAGSIAASRAPLVVEDLSKVDVINPVLRQKARSLIGAPLIVEGRLIGVIHADTARPRRFTKDDLRLLQLAADRVALAIEQTRLYEVEQQGRRHAEDANRMKDEFLALVSHELRSPLNAILGYAAMLRRSGLDAQKAEHAVNVIERSGKAQGRLIDDLLDTARIISGKLRLDIGPVDLVSVIEESVQTIRPAADAKGVSLRINMPDKIGQITGDPARLQQVVWNLLSNAVKFTPQGGSVEARLERVDPYIHIIVSDTGKGISPDFLPFVFDRFRQGDSSSAKRHGGLGLGLALVQYLVELHGGTIMVASAGEGQGATFRVTLPVRAVATPLGENGGESVTVKRSGELAGVRALVVDDEDNARELLEAALTQYGAKVVAVSSAAEAYALITATPPQELPDVMVTDIGMPGEDGYSLMRRVREWEFERGVYIPAVALTAFGRSEDRMRALISGFQMHVAKPVEPDELAAVITNLIRRRMTHRQ